MGHRVTQRRHKAKPFAYDHTLGKYNCGEFVIVGLDRPVERIHEFSLPNKSIPL